MVSRAEKILNTWANNPKIELSPGGKDWLVEALDPFHDTILNNNRGWPDVSTAGSVVQCIKSSMQVSATSGGGGAVAAPWDCHIAVLPSLLPSPYIASTTRRGAGFFWDSTVSTSGPFGGLMAMASFSAGTPVNWFPFTGHPTYLGSMGLDKAYSSGTTRVIGIGFEVHDTTAEIYRQGSCTVYRQPEPERESMVYCGTSNAAVLGSEMMNYTFTGMPMRLPPTNTAEAMLLAGSRQWASKEGCYCVGAFHSNQNPPQATSYVTPVWQQATDEDQMIATPTAADNVSTIWVRNTRPGISRTIGGLTFTSLTTNPDKIYPFHQFGAIFSGLNPNSTLTINMNVYVEHFPSIANKPLTVMSTPSCRLDTMALEIFSHALSVMPVGVPVRENGLGTWFANLISEIEPFVTPIAAAFNPVLGAVTKGAGVASRTFLDNKTVSNQGYMTSPSGSVQPQKRKKTKKKNNNLAAGNRGKKNNVQGPLNR